MSGSLWLHLTKVIFKARLFWPIWIITTATAAVFVARFAGMVSTVTPDHGRQNLRSPRPVGGEEMEVRGLSKLVIPARIVLGVFLACYVSTILVWEDFTYQDNSMFTLGFLRGHDLGPPIWRENGRFFPLGHQEFDLIHHFTSSVAGYHVFPIIELLVLCGVLLVIDEALSVPARTGLLVLLLVLPSMVTSFGGLIYTERNIVLWLAALVYFLLRFDQTHVAKWAVYAVIAAQFLIYYKETAFLLVGGLAAGRLILRCKNQPQRGWDWRRLGSREARLDLCLAALCAVFVLYYLTSMLPHPNLQYAVNLQVGRAAAFAGYLKLDGLAWLLVAVTLARTYGILRGRITPAPVWDGLAWGGLACFGAYLYLGMFSPYYLAPVDFAAVLYVGRFAILQWANGKSAGKLAVAVLASAVAIQGLLFSAFRVYERKNVIHAKAEIGRAIELHVRAGGENPQRLFFPFSSAYNMMEFGAYLSYHHIGVEGLPAPRNEIGRVVLVGNDVDNNGPCVEYTGIICRTGDAPQPGDLVVMLPDDDESTADAAPYLKGKATLLTYAPVPRLEGWLFPLAQRLRAASYAFARHKLPERWLQASVSAW